MLACTKLVLGVASFLTGFALVWVVADLLRGPAQCPAVMGRVCNDRGICIDGTCICAALYSGVACEHTAVPGYILATNEECGGNGVAMYSGYTPPECQETTPSRIVARRGGWNVRPCRNRLAAARKDMFYYDNAEPEDIAGTPTCLCFPGYAGLACEPALPRGLNLEVCSGNGNLTVDLMRNGTAGLGAQCTSILPIEAALPHLSDAQREFVGLNIAFFERGVCAELLTNVPVSSTQVVSVLVPPPASLAYKCHCNERSFGTLCEFSVCSMTEDGVVCSGNGHPDLGFGVEKNTTRAVSAFGLPGTPVCASGTTLCPASNACVQRASLCATRELACPADRPLRCSTTRLCVAEPAGTTRCALAGWQYGYYDDPNLAPAAPVANGDNRLDSRLVTYEFRIRNGSVAFVYRGRTYASPPALEGEGDTFWTGAINETFDDVARLAFDAAAETEVAVTKLRNDEVEVDPAPFFHGSLDRSVARLRSSYDTHVVLDILGSRVRLDDVQGQYIVANLSSDEILRPRGSVVSLATCLDDLVACAWPLDQSGAYSLCERDGVVGSVRGSRACALPDRAFLRATTIAIAKPRVPLEQWQGDARWFLQPLGAAPEVVRVSASGSWVGRFRTLENMRRPCACEPSLGLVPANASVLDAQWAAQTTRAAAVPAAGYALARVPAWGDAIWHRGTLDASGLRVTTRDGDELAPVTASRRLSLSEYERGVPTPALGVFPLRCPDGRGARPVVHELFNVPRTAAHCDLTATGATCDNGCTCSLRRCTCAADPESEHPLFTRLQAARNDDRKCFIIRPQVGNWTREGDCFQMSTFDVPNEFRVPEPRNVTQIRARFYGSAWTDVAFELGASAVYPVFDDVTKPFDEWCVLGADGLAEPVFMPSGVSAFRAHPDFVLSASHDAANLSNLVWNDASTWDSGSGGAFVRVDFPSAPARIVGVFLTFHTIGLPLRSGRIVSSEVRLHTGPLDASDAYKTDWTWRAETSAGVLDSSLDVYVPFLEPALAHSLRLTTHGRVVLRRFVPITDQLCPAGVLTPADRFPEDVIVSRERRIDVNASALCVSDDSCVLAGASAAADGVCSDYRFLTAGIAPVETFSTPTNLSAFEIVLSAVPEYPFLDANTTCLDADDDPYGPCCAFGASPTRDFACASSAIDVSFRNESFVYGRTLHPPFYVPRIRTLVYGPNLVEGVNTCPNGTDFTDCGASTRLDDIAPGLACEPTALEQAFQTRNASVREFQSSATVAELLGSMRMTLRVFGVSWTANYTRIGRGACGDCDGRARCFDGSCADSAAQCPTPRYDTPGDGCVRIDPDKLSYKCACKAGFGSDDCGLSECTPIDAEGSGDPASWCACGGPNDRSYPPVRIDPPFTFRIKPDGYTRRELLAMNFAGPRSLDPAREKVRFTFAPWGYAVKRIVSIGGVQRRTNCPFLKRVPDGRLVDRDQCIAATDALTGQITQWRAWPMANGSFVTYAWDLPWGKLKYDDAPIRCPSGACVADERECYMQGVVNPACGGRGTCRVDGTCDCNEGWATFALTDRVSRVFAIPYASNAETGASEPTRTDVRDDVWSHAVACKARNCTSVDCAPPYGCFAGTPALGFADKNATCTAATGYEGLCSFDLAACKRGLVSLPIPCSGNGVLRKRDYKDEWYCACGEPRSVLVQSAERVRETVELVPNGFGGPRCDQYECQDDAKLVWFQRTDPQTNLPYLGSDGIPLPGKWRGPCEAPVGPKSEEFGLWRQCCGLKRLDQCTRIPCRKGLLDVPGKSRVVCEEAHLCQDENAQPLVYVCNGHGQPLADGTCACSNTATEGFTYDESIWSGKGCIRRAQCEIAVTSRTMCNAQPNCAGFRTWPAFPKIEYFDQQALALLALAGLPPTNQTLVDLLFRDDRAERINFVGAQTAQTVVDALADVANTVCVLSATEDPDNPPGMLPYDPDRVGRYGEGFDAPYLVANVSARARSGVSGATIARILSDGSFGGGARTENVDFVRLHRTASSSDSDASVSIVLHFPRPTRVRGIRIYARRVSVAEPTIEVFDPAIGATFGAVCDFPNAVANANFDWLGGSQNTQYCVPRYASFDFRADAYRTEFKANCVPEEFAVRCTQWKDTLCTALGHTVNPPGVFLKLLPGCLASSRCCVAITTPRDDPVSSIEIRLPASPLDHTLDIGELQVYGAQDAVDPTPQAMTDFIQNKVKTVTECRDAVLMLSVFGGQSLTYHLARNYLGWPISTNAVPEASKELDSTKAKQACEAVGSVYASSRGGADSPAADAATLGAACFTGNSQIPCLVNAEERETPKTPVRGDIVRASCATWGCWTPNLPLDHIDYFSTARNDTDGRQWMTEWAGADYLRLDDAVADLIEESRMQSELTLYSWSNGNARAALVRYNLPLILDRRAIISPGAFESSDAFRTLAKQYLYRPIPVSNFESTGATVRFARRSTAAALASRAGSTRISNTTMWTNPKVCTLTVYSRPLCGVGAFSSYTSEFNGDSEPCPVNWITYIFTSVPNYCWVRAYHKTVDRGASKTFVITPADDYALLSDSLSNFLLSERYDTCVGGGTSCAALGQLIFAEVSTINSISISGPCAMEIRGIRPDNPRDDVVDYRKEYTNEVFENGDEDWRKVNQRGSFAYYIESNRAKPSKIQYADDASSTINSAWPDGCYGSFENVPPLTSSTDFIDAQSETASQTGTNFFDVKRITTNSRVRFGAPYLPNVGITAIRVMARFTSRKISIDYRPNTVPCTPRNENDYVLDYASHPYMCTRARVFELKRVYAGVRFPEKYIPGARMLFDGVVRVKRSTTHVFEAWGDQRVYPSGAPTAFASMDAYDPVRLTTNFVDHAVPRESMSGEYAFTAADLREGMQQLVNNGYARVAGKPGIIQFKGANTISLGDFHALNSTYTRDYYGVRPTTFMVYLVEVPLSAPILAVGEITRGVAFEDSEVVFPFSKCDGVELPREVRRCNTCLQPIVPNWEWNQQFYNPQNFRYVQAVDGMSAAPQLHVSWNSTKYPAREEFQPISKYETTRPDAYARLWSTFVPEDFRKPLARVDATAPAYYMDTCAVVDRTAVGFATFEYKPVLCEAERFRALCQYDYTRYTVRPGLQCDACGNSARSAPLQPNRTAFDQFPRAVRANFPAEHAIADAWREGRLEEYFELSPVPADAIVAFVQSQPVAIAPFLPGFFAGLLRGASTRPGYVSAGLVGSEDLWLDLAFQRMFPHDCGVVYSRFTGAGRAMCAKSAEFCTRDVAFEAPFMPEEDYPKALRGVPAAVDARAEPQCGRYVRPWDLLRGTEDDPAPPNDGMFTLQSYAADGSVTVKTARAAEGHVRNTYRDLDVFLPRSVLRVELECLGACAVQVWIGSRSPSFAEPADVLDLGAPVGAGVHYLTVDDYNVSTAPVYRTMGWRFVAPTPKGAVITLKPVLVTDDDSVAACRRTRISSVWREPPPNVDSPAPQHMCVFTDRIASVLGVRDVGVCWCSDASPFGGPTCEWLATRGRHGKRICGTAEGVRTGPSRAIAPTGEVVRANDRGAFQYIDAGGRLAFGCKARADVGSVIRTRLAGAMSDFRYVVKSLARPNQEPYQTYTPAEVRDLLFNFPVVADSARDACAAFSASLASFATSDEVESYLQTAALPVFLDVANTTSLAWSDRGERVRANKTREVVDPCGAPEPKLCRALMFNNYLYDAASALADGSVLTGATTVPAGGDVELDTRALALDVSENRKTALDVVVLAATDPALTLSVDATNGTDWYACGEIDERGTAACALATPITRVRVSAPLLATDVTEVGAFWARDPARVYPFR